MARRALGGAPSQARFVALIALLLPWSTTGLIFAMIPWPIAFAFVDLREFPGWIYVFGVGVAGGMTLARKAQG